MINDKKQKIIALIQQEFTSHIIKIDNDLDELTITIEPDYITNVLTYLRDEKNLMFKQLIDLCIVDYIKQDQKFIIVYHLLSHRHNQRIRIKIHAREFQAINSVSTIYNSANWYEREGWDMFGVKFKNHPNLKRLLTDYGFNGHPLRKDFPLIGYVEPHYDNQSKKIVYDNVKLPQEYRDFNFLNDWQGYNQTAKIKLPGDEKANEAFQKQLEQDKISSTSDK